MLTFFVLQASALYLALLESAKESTERLNGSAAGSKIETVRVKSEPQSPVYRETRKPTADSARPPFYSPPHVKLSRALNSSPSPSKKVLPGMEHMTVECWKLMLADGWESLAQANGKVLIKMPGVSFFDIRPNENVFDSLPKACNKYLRDWALAVRDIEDDDASATLMDLIWPMIEASGWTKITAAAETWYMMPNTTFKDYKPNVTLFRSKTQVISKFLVQAGIIDAPPEAAAVVAESQEEEEVDQDMDDAMDVDDSQGDDSSENDTASEEDRSSESADEEVPAAPTKRSRPSSSKPGAKTSSKSKQPPAKAKPATQQKPTVAAPTTAAKKLTFERKPIVNIPPFKCTLGKIEVELRSRGWYWKPGVLDWTYFKPHCRLKDMATLTAGEDYFNGRPELDEHLKVTGLYDDIYDKLYSEHKAMYVDSDDEDDEVVENKAKKTTPKASAPAPQRPKTAASNNDDDKENQSSNVMANTSKTSKAKPLSVKKQPLAVNKPSASVAKPSASFKRRRGAEPVGPQVKFGDVWKVLERQGWHLKYGKFEYDYFKPSCKDATHGVMGVDYFVSRSLLISYLETSGIWDKIAKQIANGEDVVDTVESSPSGDGEEAKPEDDPTAAASPVAKRRALIKRKSIERTPQNPAGDEASSGGKANTKKARVSGSFRTPTEHKRSGARVSDDGHDSDTADTISPDTASQRTGAHESSSLSRNLADCFTPSPGNMKKDKTSDATGPQALFSAAIQRLTLGHSVSKFQYRDDETRVISEFFQTCFAQRHGSSMYISGAPGCGKSALLKASEARITQLYQVRRVLLLLLLVGERAHQVSVVVCVGRVRGREHAAPRSPPRQRRGAE